MYGCCEDALCAFIEQFSVLRENVTVSVDVLHFICEVLRRVPDVTDDLVVRT